MSSHQAGSPRSAARKLLFAPLLVTATAVAISLPADAAFAGKPTTPPGQAKKATKTTSSSSDSSGTGRKIR